MGTLTEETVTLPRILVEMMRLLVACSSCRRQYDATGSDPGHRFRCLCGETLTVPQPQSHDAAVVRCSSCGATRQGEASSCDHCGSDFTLRERDLHTICPTCAARVSDRARYCHHCATRLDPQGRPAEATTKTCPACGDGHRVTSRDFGVDGLSILECPRCAGLWLSHDAFRHLVERAEASPATSKVHAMAAARSAAAASGTTSRVAQTGSFYRPCPACGRLMQRRNYDEKSGVVIDVCGAHGVWFDDDELAAILRWIRQGRSRLAREQAAAYREERERRSAKTPHPTSYPPVGRTLDDREAWTLLEFLLEAGTFFFRMLR
jgi:Zn-finger nucleic acid-binding protein